MEKGRLARGVERGVKKLGRVKIEKVWEKLLVGRGGVGRVAAEVHSILRTAEGLRAVGLVAGFL